MTRWAAIQGRGLPEGAGGFNLPSDLGVLGASPGDFPAAFITVGDSLLFFRSEAKRG